MKTQSKNKKSSARRTAKGVGSGRWLASFPMNSDTPRTDAEECEAITGLGRCVGVNFARRLERENAMMRVLLSDVIEGSVDARTYPDGPCLDRELRNDIKAFLANGSHEPCPQKTKE